MLIRIVRMTFHPGRVGSFLSVFEDTAPRIQQVSGCTHLELWQDLRHPNILTTYSRWTDEAALQSYRQSDLFRSTWKQVKPYFAARAQAHSYRQASASDPPAI